MTIDTAVYTRDNYLHFCDLLMEKDVKIASMVAQYGYPPMWKRRSDFEGLVRIIIEQQVSLASAFSVLKKLRNRIGRITPEKISQLSDRGFKECGFSRQKTRYVRILCDEVLNGRLVLKDLENLENHEIRSRLTAITGIGQWTCDVYLLLCLRRLDIFPSTDLALVNAMKENAMVPAQSGKDQIEKTALRYRPYRSILSMILWHAYIKKRGMVVT